MCLAFQGRTFLHNSKSLCILSIYFAKCERRSCWNFDHNYYISALILDKECFSQKICTYSKKTPFEKEMFPIDFFCKAKYQGDKILSVLLISSDELYQMWIKVRKIYKLHFLHSQRAGFPKKEVTRETNICSAQ